jgi:signal peptidase I
MVFGFRHPWATDMEQFMHIGDVLMFNKISYEEVRGIKK